MRNIPDIIDALGGNSAVARILAKGPSTVSEMRRNQTIKIKYWRELVTAAVDPDIALQDGRDVFLLTNDILVEAHVNPEPESVSND